MTKALFSILLAVSIASISFAQSQGPTPGPLKSGDTQQEDSYTRNTHARNQQRGTEEFPFIVKEASPKTKTETDYERYQRDTKPAYEKAVVWISAFIAFVTAILAIFTGYLWFATRKLVVTSERTAIQQMRAYLSVSFGSGIFQERERNLRFEVNPILINTGQTPGHNITYWAKADILPFPLPDEFKFPPPEETTQSSYVLGPGQNLILNAMVNDWVPDEEVAEIKRGDKRRPCIWGVVFYTDVFGEEHKTEFCHSINWFYNSEGKEISAGTYARRHSEAT